MRDTWIADSRVLAPLSRALFLADLRDGPAIESSSGALVARTGERASWSRGSASLTGVEAANGTYTATRSVMAFEPRVDAAGATRVGLRQGTSDILTFPITFGPQDMSGALEFWELGARAVPNATLLAISNAGPTGWRFYLDSSGTHYRANWSDGSTTRSATLSVGQPSPGQFVTLSWTLLGGVLTLQQAINANSPQSAGPAAALTPPDAWASGTVLRIGRRGDTENPAALTWTRCAIFAGEMTAAEIAEAW